MPLLPQVDVVSLTLVTGVIISSIIAIHQWWSKHQLEKLETKRAIAATGTSVVEAQMNVMEAQATVAKNSLEVVQLVIGLLNTMKQELLHEMQKIGTSLGETIVNHTKDDETRFNEVMTKLDSMKKPNAEH